MLIDSRQTRWVLVTAALGVAALVAYDWLSRTVPGGRTGGSTVGLWYGIAGSALMVFAGLLSALRKVPSWWWIGSRKFWLKGHIWLGLLSTVFIFCHSGYSWGGLLERILWIVFVLVLVTGILGLILQQFLPRLITLRIGSEAPYEQIPHLCQLMRRQADKLIESIWDVEIQVSQANLLASQMGMGAKVQLQQFYEKHIRPYLSDGDSRSALLTNGLQAEAAFARLRALPGLAEVKDQMAQLETLCDERRQLAEQERLHFWLHSWLLVHVPLSVLLLILGGAHVVMTTLYY